MTGKFNLLGDLGGTNVRFGLAYDGSTEVTAIEKFSIKDYEDLSHIIKVYLKGKKAAIGGACIAIAGPIVDGTVRMTNRNWEISDKQIAKTLGTDNVALINDFEAIALSVPKLPTESLTQIGKVNGEKTGPITVFGPGTGLGAALLVPTSTETYEIIPTEGGHAGLSARSSDELAIFDYWRDKGSRINREFFVCGSGIERIHEALCVMANCDDYKKYSVVQIQQLGCSRKDAICEKAMEIFCGFLGSAAGDQALCTGSTGGVVLAGGILPKFVDFLKDSNFRKRFESKGAMSDYTKAISTHLIVEEQPGLIGAAAYLC